MAEKKLCSGCMEMKPITDRYCPYCGYDETAPYDTNYIAPGTVLNERYTVGVMLGHNSEGATYIAYNQSIGCKVLIREYMPEGLCVRVKNKPTISVNPKLVVQYKALMAEFTDLNKRLAQMRSLSHINPALDLFAENNTTYVVYEYLEGIQLVDFLKDNAGELTWKQVSEMFPTFFTTLSLMHNNGIIHRAISPDTIYVTPKNELRLCGFSIPAVRTVDTELPCELFAGYAAPEQYSSTAKQGTWTDVYGICAVLYRILTGCKPTDAPSRMQNDNLCEPYEMNPNIPRNVSRVIMQGLNLFYDDRIHTVTELVTRLFEQEPEPEPKLAPAAPPRREQRYQPAPQQYDNRRYEPADDYDEPKDSVIDRIKIPIIIGVLLTCVLLVIAIVVLNLLDMGPFSSNKTSRSRETTTTSYLEDAQDNIVTEFNDSADEAIVAGNSYMPDLVGKSYENRKTTLEAEGWLFLEPVYEFSNEYKAGLITWQELKPGELFTEGATIQVGVSKGPSKIILPPYEGKQLSAYKAELEALGLTNYNTEAVVNYSYHNGEVIELSREAGEEFDLTGDETLKITYASNPEPATAAAVQTTAVVETTAEPVVTTDAPTEVPTDPPTETPTDPPTEAPPTEPPATQEQGGEEPVVLE